LLENLEAAVAQFLADRQTDPQPTSLPAPYVRRTESTSTGAKSESASWIVEAGFVDRSARWMFFDASDVFSFSFAPETSMIRGHRYATHEPVCQGLVGLERGGVVTDWKTLSPLDLDRLAPTAGFTAVEAGRLLDPADEWIVAARQESHADMRTRPSPVVGQTC
jgi:hypothetical protein